MQLRLLIDENLSPGLRHVAREFGILANHVNDLGLAGKSDAQVLQACLDRDHVLVTSNADEFLGRYKSRADLHAGLIVFRGIDRLAAQEEALRLALETAVEARDIVNRAIEIALVEVDDRRTLVARHYDWPPP